MSGEFGAWLRGLGPDGLATLLRMRPDAVAGVAPATIEDLAQRLSGERSTMAAMAGVTALSHQLVELLTALGGEPTRAELDARVYLPTPADAAAVEIALDALIRRGLVLDSGGRLRLVGAARSLYATPLGLGPPLQSLLPTMQTDVLEHIRRTLGLPPTPPRTKADKAIAATLTSVRILELVRDAPEDTRTILNRAAQGNPRQYAPGGTLMTVLPNRWRRDSPMSWAVDRALLLPWDYDTVALPREVALAMRGEDWSVGLATAPPEVRTAAVDAVSVEREARAASTAFLAAVTDVLGDLASAPGAALKSGGMGTREQRRLAKVTGAGEETVELALELAGLTGLLTIQDGSVLPTPEYDEWRAGEPATRLVGLLAAWWLHGAPLSGRRDHTGKAMPVLFTASWDDPGVRALRQGMLAVMAGLPEGRGALSADSVLAHVRWVSPMSSPRGDAGALDRLAESAWREAALLGVSAHGRATALGAALVAADHKALLATAAALLPAVETTATFQADLTALVTGTPGTALTALLDGAAQREARGGATVWRFSPASVRRYLDTGGTADGLTTALRGVARGELPQPLVYLVGDVGRRHGHMGVTALSCAIVSPDAALLAEVAASRSLRALECHLLAPTVLASAKPAAETIGLLREAGYSPVRRDRTGAIELEKAERKRAAHRHGRVIPASRTHLTSAADDPALEQLARAILLGQPSRVPQARPPHPSPGDPAPEETIAVFAPTLGEREVALLAEAVETGDEVVIDYLSSQGKHTKRIISDCELLPPFLDAWCHLSGDDRSFTLSRIVAVTPA